MRAIAEHEYNRPEKSAENAVHESREIEDSAGESHTEWSIYRISKIVFFFASLDVVYYMSVVG